MQKTQIDAYVFDEASYKEIAFETLDLRDKIDDFSQEDTLVIRKVTPKIDPDLGDEKFELTDNNNDTIIVELDDDRNWSYIEKDMPIEIIAKVDDEKVTKILEVKCARPDFGDKMPRQTRTNGPRGFEQ